jgi:hypothetical protein
VRRLLVWLLLVLAVEATSFGGVITATLLAVDRTVGVTPTTVGCADFAAAPVNTKLDGYVTACGNTWQAHVGSWSILPDGVASDQRATPLATMDTAVSAYSVAVDMTGLATADTNRSGGVVGSFSPAGTVGPWNYLAAVMTAGSPARLDLRVVLAGVATTVASTAVVVTATSSRLVLERSGSTVTVAVDGARRITATLTAAQVAALTGGRTGLVGGSNAIRFFNVAVAMI